MFKKATQIIATEDEQDSQAPCAKAKSGRPNL